MSYLPHDPQFGPQGGAAVGVLRDLPLLEFGAVMLLRAWCDGTAPEGTTKVLGNLVALLVEQGRRPLMRHAAGCVCLGADEAVFAGLVATATRGDRDEAMALAMAFLPAAPAFDAVYLAGQLGLVILRLSRATPARPH